MKTLITIIRIFVGIFFMLSGFVKLDDPIGFSYKLQEYFGAGVLNMEFLIPFALAIAIFIVVFEFLLGVMLLLGFAPKFTMWCLLLMIVFFTFLTFYSAYTGKVTDCGCFGSAVKLTPWESFWKDIILLILILLLFFKREYLTPVFSEKTGKWVVLAVGLSCFAFAYYVLMHLPLIDFRAYKVETNIQEGMSHPEGAPEAVYDYNWKFMVDGEEKIITTEGSFPEVKGDLIGVETELVSKGYVPPIHDFSMEKNGIDYTDELLAKDKLIIITAYDLGKSDPEGWRKTKKAIEKAKEQGYTVVAVSAAGPELAQKTKSGYGLEIPFYIMDATTIKTMVRANPGLMKLSNGTILQKLHWSDADELEL